MKHVIDAGRFGGAPLTKKYAMFHSGLVPMKRYRRDMHWFDAVDPQSLRIDLFIGQSVLDGNPLDFGDVVGGDTDHLTFDFTLLDELVQMLHNKQVLPYWSWCYMPKPVQIDGDFRRGPSDMDAYARIMERYAAHYREKGLRLGYQEVYNEPDCHDVFLQGPYEDYLNIYRAAAPALRRGDKDAVVGGPSSAFVLTDEEQKKNLSSFLQMVEEEKLPLDFFSYHSYGYAEGEYVSRTELVRNLIGDHPYYKATELHMNELNVIPPAWDYGSWQAEMLGGRQLLPLTFEAIKALNVFTDLTLVHWAQLLNSGVDALGLVNSDGTACPGYAAFDIYQRMPVRPLQVEDAHMLASADENRVALVVWNGAKEARQVELDWANLPFAEGEAAVYRLDEAFFRQYDGTLTPAEVLPLEKLPHCFTLQENDVAYVEINRKGYTPCRRRALTGGKRYVRTRYYFDQREKNTVACFDEKKSTACLGMGNNAAGLAVCACEMEVQTADTLHLTPSVMDMQDGCLAVRVDYAVGLGWVSGPVYATKAGFELPALPFGAQEAPVSVQPMAAAGVEIPLAQHAPAGWTGRVLVTFILKDAGRNSWAEMILA